MTGDYILLTAAKDEEAMIAEVIRGIIRQTVHPQAWFIVDDGSSDGTAAIVEGYVREHSFIRLCTTRAREGRNFGSKDKALQSAYTLAEPLNFEFVAVLDADSIPERDDYYEQIFQEFSKNPDLGMMSGTIYERLEDCWKSRPDNSADSTAGSGVVFRRACFDLIGGYVALPYGGSDWLSQIDAKRKGWQLRTRTDLHVLHYRPTSSAGGLLRGIFRAGLMDASFGSHPLFEVFKCARRLATPPILLGGLVRFAGYLWWSITGRGPLISPEQVAFLRCEQLAKLRRWMVSPVSGKSSGMAAKCP